MNLLLFNPQLAERTCDLCQRFQWCDEDDKLSGKKKCNRFGEPFPRPAGIPTPCSICPKKNPEVGRKIERSLPRVISILDRYYRVKATGPADEDCEPVIRQALGICEQFVRMSESMRAVM